VPNDLRKNGSKAPRILIVDDDPGQRSLLDSFSKPKIIQQGRASHGPFFRQVNDEIVPFPVLRLPPEFDEQTRLFSVIHQRDAAAKEDHAGMAGAFLGQVSRVHRHRPAVKTDQDEIVLLQRRKQNRVLGHAMLAAQPIRKVNQRELRLKARARRYKMSRHVAVGHKTNHSLTSASRCVAV